MAHTKGPWKYASAVRDNAPNYFAVITGEWGQPSVADCQSEENARLIAAAPELLTLANDYLESARFVARNDDNQYQVEDVDRANEAIARIEKVLAKVKCA